jgi:hypothetical protein
MKIPESLRRREDLGVLVENDREVKTLQRALSDAPRDLNILRSALSSSLRRQAWMERLDPEAGEYTRFEAEQFREFITTPLWRGLGTDERTLRKLISDEPELLVLFEQAIALPPGGANNPQGLGGWTHKEVVTVDNVNNDKIRRRDSPTGNETAYAIRKLAKDAPSLLERVKTGELSPHRAMIEAGFRREKTHLEWVYHHWQRCSEEERRAFKATLDEMRG